MIRTDRSHLFIAARTDPGMSGKINEDNFAVSAYVVSPANPTPTVFAILSDGIGGHKAGEVASEMVVNIISQAVEKREGGHPLTIFEKSFQAANQAILKKATEDTQFDGMGATAACAWVIGEQLFIAYAGDSRIYLLRGKQIKQLSHDHTWVQEALDKGVLQPGAGMQNHPNLHVIRRYLGSDQLPEPDLRLYLQPGENDARAKGNQGLQLHAGDIILLCSDGLSDLVSDREMLSMVYGRTLTQTAQALINLANERGGRDNITVLMLGMPWAAGKLNPGWLPG